MPSCIWAGEIEENYVSHDLNTSVFDHHSYLFFFLLQLLLRSSNVMQHLKDAAVLRLLFSSRGLFFCGSLFVVLDVFVLLISRGGDQRSITGSL